MIKEIYEILKGLFGIVRPKPVRASETRKALQEYEKAEKAKKQS